MVEWRMVYGCVYGENMPMDTLSAPLIDRFGRKIDYLRLSVTDRCDLRCSYCMPKTFKGFEDPGDWLTFDEIERVVRIFVRMGTSRVRLTGGEPFSSSPTGTGDAVEPTPGIIRLIALYQWDTTS